jgi:protein-S-isoprenylcysteine O-methyltransferase Ste14
MPLPPDAYAALSIIIALLLEWLVPLEFLPEPAVDSWATPVGLVIAAGGFALEIAAARTLGMAGTSARPNEAPRALATGGPFRFTRNPFYCGIILLIAGGAIVGSLDWWLVLAPAFWLALDRLVVPFEERRLDAAFGKAYQTYASKTPRWLWR